MVLYTWEGKPTTTDDVALNDSLGYFFLMCFSLLALLQLYVCMYVMMTYSIVRVHMVVFFPLVHFLVGKEMVIVQQTSAKREHEFGWPAQVWRAWARPSDKFSSHKCMPLNKYTHANFDERVCAELAVLNNNNNNNGNGVRV